MPVSGVMLRHVVPEIDTVPVLTVFADLEHLIGATRCTPLVAIGSEPLLEVVELGFVE
jgi:hypothetical protein